MELSGIHASGSLPAPQATGAASTVGNGFGRMLTSFLGDASGQQSKAEQAVQGLALGQSDNLHGVLLQMAKADLSFQLVLEVRNRLLNAYQEVMQMPV